MTPRAKLELTLGILGLILMALGGREWLVEHDARLKAEATVVAQQEARQALDAQVQKLAQQQADFQRQQDQKMVDLQGRFGQAQSPTQVAALVAQVMGLKQPIQIVTPPATPENPHPQPVAQVATADAPQVKEYLRECEECKLNLQTAKQQLSFADQQKVLDADKLKNMTEQRDTWKETAQGGSVWKRTLHVVQWVLPAAAGGYLAGRTHR